MGSSKKRRVSIIDIIRVAEVVRPILTEVFEFAGDGGRLKVSFTLRKVGKKPWQIKLEGKPDVVAVD